MTDQILSNKFTPVLVVLLIVGSFFLGSLTTKVKMLEKGTVAGVAQGANNNQPAAPAAQAPQVTKGVASIDDDPILGDKNAPVTIIEFSDYECPFCKRHFDSTHPELVKKYIDTGKVKLVFRDFPLSFHEPMASKEAIAASCARPRWR